MLSWPFLQKAGHAGKIKQSQFVFSDCVLKSRWQSVQVSMGNRDFLHERESRAATKTNSKTWNCTCTKNTRSQGHPLLSRSHSRGFSLFTAGGGKNPSDTKTKTNFFFFLASWHLKAGSLIPAIIAGETLTKTHTHTQTYSLVSTGRMQKHNSQEYLHLSASACSVTAALWKLFCESALLEDLQENCPSVKINA